MKCELCGCPLLPENASGWCRECALVVSARLNVVIEERWRVALIAVLLLAVGIAM